MHPEPPSPPVGFSFKDLHGSGTELEEFIRLYDIAFFDPSEREDPHQWSLMLQQAAVPPHPVFFLSVVIHDASGRVAAGLAYEFYRSSRCGLLTYLVVDPCHRRLGLARALVNHAIRELELYALKSGSSVLEVFSEYENPALVDPESSIISPRLRAAILDSLGLNRVDMHYVQPQLHGGIGRSRNLLLAACLPKKDGLFIEGSTLIGFLKEFYEALGITEPQRDPDFLGMLETIGNVVRLLPTKEDPDA